MEIEKLCWIAKIKLSEEEKREIEKDFEEILRNFEVIMEIGEEVEEERRNIELREGKVEKFDSEEIIKNFPSREKKLLRVPRFL